MILSDSHMHTIFSTDSDTPMEKMIDGAIAKGLRSICITDHFDKDFPSDTEFGKDAFQFDLDEYMHTMKKIQKEYEDKIHIRIGIELGLQTHLQEFYQKLTQQYPFDFVIGSVHLVDGKDPYYREGFAELSDRELYRKGFENTLENLQHVTAFDVLGHLDYVVRYGTYKEKEYSQTEFSDIIDEILKRVIELGKGIELNTAGWKYGLPFCNPHPDVLKRYRELGGEIITIGADGHKPEHIAYDFGKVNDVLKACGFKYYTEFEERKPIFKQLT